MLTNYMQNAVALEIANDPANRGYSGLQPAQQAALMNVPYTIPGPSVSQPPRVAQIFPGIAGTPNALTASHITNALASKPDPTLPLEAQIILVNEINTDPTNQGYANQTAAQQAVLLNTNYNVPGDPINQPSRISIIFGYSPDAPLALTATDITASMTAFPQAAGVQA